VTSSNIQPGSTQQDDSSTKPTTAPSLVQFTAVPGNVTAVAVVLLIALVYGVEVIPIDPTIVEVHCKNVAIVGGGVTGIAATYALTRSDDFKVDLIESRSRFGGAAYSNTVNGIAVDHAFTAMLNFHNFESFVRRELNVEISSHSAGASAVLETQSGDWLLYGNSVAGQDGRNSSAYVDFSPEISRLSASEVEVSILAS